MILANCSLNMLPLKRTKAEVYLELLSKPYLY